ncbi:replication-relaxation family protein [Streptomyces sp. NBC_00576]|uniref:replication-relaxation family protein n=1 Tax=Streptomyces sp. NBC_00576 TaxID=2903665 RepID=UPI002E8064C2|nr:replication-relaxation family protein [Streptomyces sp. NBC_00576]WUB69570.1 replication-relaxation family protein [Streptomyces sp. NBC_00576]
MDEEILRAINRLQYMTAAQVGRLLYPDQHDDNRYVQRRLRSLVEAGYLLRLRELPAPRIGSAPHVFTLADRGRRFVAGRGDVLASSYYRPSEERAKARDNPFMEHTLAAVDVLVAAESLCRRFQVSMPRLLNERQLKRSGVRVQPAGRPDAPRVAVIPDAWFELQVSDDPSVAITLELDRDTEGQKHWRRKIAALTAWAEGPYRRAFEVDNLTVAVAAPSTPRREQLSAWTHEELEDIGKAELADIFLFTEASPVETDPFELFFSPCWYPAGAVRPVSLLDPLPEVPEQEAAAVHSKSAPKEPEEPPSPPGFPWVLMDEDQEEPEWGWPDK